MMGVWITWLLGSLALILAMTGLWLTHGRRGNAGIVDVAWTLGVGGLGLAYCGVASQGDGWRRLGLAIVVSLWAGRLAWHIWHRVQRMPEDGRYVELKAAWGEAAPRKMFWFFMFQAVAASVFSLPILVAAANPVAFGWWDVAALGLAGVAVGGESVADRQLQRFREAVGNRGKTCRSGLWRYSRHPNYFFEWLHWFVYAFFAVTAPWGWVTFLAPVAMLHFILNVTGVPPTERQALKSRGDDYRAYQSETSVFFPWFPKRATASRSTSSAG